ncbi:MAG: metallophosphoesterase family protein [bacterium]
MKKTINPLLCLLVLSVFLISGCGGSSSSSSPFFPTPTPTPTSSSMSIVHGPRLGLVTSNEATIAWDTNQPALGQVKWGTSSTYSSTLQESAAVTNHRLTITGLSPGLTYHYQVVAGTASSQDNTFKTAVPAGTDFTFISMADSRGGSDHDDIVSLPQAFLNIVQLASSKNAYFVVNAGDIFYGYNPDITQMRGLYDSFKRATDPLAKNTPLLVSPGNHEMSPFNSQYPTPGFDPLQLFNEEFAQPQVLPGFEGTVFSWDCGNSHFASVDSCKFQAGQKFNGFCVVNDVQLAWLENDLQQAQARHVRHIFVFSHSHAWKESTWTLWYMGNANEVQRDKFWNLLIQYKVDAYICGHMHLFNDQLGQGGVVQWLNGNSGSVSAGTAGNNEWTLWTISGDTATAQLIDDAGAVTYTRVIHSSQP